MNKADFAAYLNEKGYPAENDSGVVMIQKSLTKTEEKAVQNLVKEAGYRASYGYRLCNG